MTAQELLRDAWLEGPEGKLCGRERAKAWALRSVWISENKYTYGMLPFIAQLVRKTKNSKPSGGHPSTASLLQLFGKAMTTKSGLQENIVIQSVGPNVF